MTKLIILSILIILHQTYQRNWVELMIRFWAQTRVDHTQILRPRSQALLSSTQAPRHEPSLPRRRVLLELATDITLPQRVGDEFTYISMNACPNT